MNWGDERYVRAYTRDTTDYLMWSWEAQALWWQLLRKFNRAGVLELGRHGLKGICAHVKMPWEVAGPALDELLDDGCIELREGSQDGSSYLFARSYVEANEAHQTDKARQQASRDRKKDMERLQSMNGSDADNSVTPRDSSVTQRDKTSRARPSASRDVTPCLPCLPSVPSQKGEATASPPADHRAFASQVIGHLNQQAKAGFTPSAPHVDLIRARHAEGYELADFIRVIDAKAAEWLTDEKMRKYLRPKTLFARGNFASYADESRNAQPSLALAPPPAEDMFARIAAREAVGK